MHAVYGSGCRHKDTKWALHRHMCWRRERGQLQANVNALLAQEGSCYLYLNVSLRFDKRRRRAKCRADEVPALAWDLAIRGTNLDHSNQLFQQVFEQEAAITLHITRGASLHIHQADIPTLMQAERDRMVYIGVVVVFSVAIRVSMCVGEAINSSFERGTVESAQSLAGHCLRSPELYAYSSVGCMAEGES